MKNQYVGDACDYFKLDVLDALANGLRRIERLTSIWMLTPSDGSNHGKKEQIEDPELSDLNTFFRALQGRSDAQPRSVRNLEEFLGSRSYRLHSHGADLESFGSTDRYEYFSGIPTEALEDSVIFFDPDTGMEPKHCKPAHVRHSELTMVLNRASPTSIAVVYQQARHDTTWLNDVGQRIMRECDAHVGYIAESTLAFFIVARSPQRRDEAVEILDGVAERTNVNGGTTVRTAGVI